MNKTCFSILLIVVLSGCATFEQKSVDYNDYDICKAWGESEYYCDEEKRQVVYSEMNRRHLHGPACEMTARAIYKKLSNSESKRTCSDVDL